MIAKPLVRLCINIRMKPPFELKPHEEILETIHQSIVPHLPRLSLYVLWVLVPFFFLFPLFRQGLAGVLIFLGLAVSGGIMLWRYAMRLSGTVLVITDKRVIDIDQRGFFDRVVTETAYPQIDEVSYRVKGFFPTIFRYGSIRLSLNGSAANIQFDRLFRPARAHNLINDLRQEYRERMRMTE